ncbi:MAG TPA: sigma-70 family RNA polymerase sigma factor [Puia sp.]
MSEELFQAIQSGDEAAFARFCVENSRRIIYFIDGIVRHTEVAEELASTCFLQVWNGRARIENAKHLNASLYRIARHRAIDYVRTSKNRPKESDPLPDWVVDESYYVGLEPQSDIMSMIYTEIEKMGGKSGEVLLLDLQGFDTAAIAERLGTTDANVYQLRHRGLANLRKVLLAKGAIRLLLIIHFLLSVDNQLPGFFSGN